MEYSPKKTVEVAAAAEKLEEETKCVQTESKGKQLEETKSLDISEGGIKLNANQEQDDVDNKTRAAESEIQAHELNNDAESACESVHGGPKDQEEIHEADDEIMDEEKVPEPVFDGTEDPGMNVNQSTSPPVLDVESLASPSAWPGKAAALKQFVKVKSLVAVHTLLRRLSGKRNDVEQDVPYDSNEVLDEPKDNESLESPKAERKSIWNPLSYIKMIQNDKENNDDQKEAMMEASLEPLAMKGRIILYSRLGCGECRETRLFLHMKRLRYFEINVDVYPTRKLELEKISGSSAVPKIFFNEALVGSLKELMELEESGKLDEKIKNLIVEAPSMEAPLPPFSGEGDVSSRAPVDELALIVRKMKPCIVKDHFYKMRRFRNSFLGSEAVDFLSEDQYLEREEAIEVARKLASQLFFRHVLDENLFEDGNHLYRCLDDDPIISSQCHNIPRGIIDLKPKPITEIASRLRFLCLAILEAYTSPDRKHVDYRSIHGSEEFARYLRIIQELHRAEIQDMKREEKLAFFINLYNMMAIHAILVWGHPTGPLERRKMFGDFKYVIGGCTYSLSAIQNGILRGNQRPPYNIMKPFGAKDKRSKVALPYMEPLIHFALVSGTRSGPAIRCFSPVDIDNELMEAAQDFLRGGGLIVDLNAKVTYISKIFGWYGIDFGKNEMEVLKHASNYLEPTLSETLLELLVDTRLKVIYQPYDWGLNN